MTHCLSFKASQILRRKYAVCCHLALSLIILGLFDQVAAEEKPPQKTEDRIQNRPLVPGKLLLHVRSRVETAKGSQKFKPIVGKVEWKTAETAIIICDMWADHPCQSSAQRVAAMAPRMNLVVTAARNHGVMVIHAPSNGMKFYEGTPFRRRMQAAPTVKPPVPIQGWCYLDSDREGKLPINDADGGCDDPNPKPKPGFDRHEYPAIKIVGYDGVSDNGAEVYNFCVQQGIKNIVMMGVHTNMCVLGRSFGIRQLVRLGFNVVLVRDLTDAMYDPRDYPHVSHTRGTQLVVEHIESHWCPSVLGKDLTKIIAGSADPNPKLAKQSAESKNAAKK